MLKPKRPLKRNHVKDYVDTYFVDKGRGVANKPEKIVCLLSNSSILASGKSETNICSQLRFVACVDCNRRGAPCIELRSSIQASNVRFQTKYNSARAAFERIHLIFDVVLTNPQNPACINCDARCRSIQLLKVDVACVHVWSITTVFRSG